MNTLKDYLSVWRFNIRYNYHEPHKALGESFTDSVVFFPDDYPLLPYGTVKCPEVYAYSLPHKN